MRFLALLLAVAAISGCGELERSVGPVEGSARANAKLQSEEEARAALADRDIDFTAAEFVEWAAEGDLEVVRLFVEGGMSVDTAYIGRYTAIHLAARNGHLVVVLYLVSQGASVLAETEHGNTAWDLAAEGGHTEIVTYLESQGAAVADTVAEVSRTPEEALAALDSLGIDFTRRVFLEAAEAGDLDVVELFVEAGMSLEAANDRGATALIRAALEGRLRVVKYLIEQGADVSFTALVLAATYGHLEVARYLVEAGADVNATTNDGDTALHRAAWFGRLSVVKYLVEQGADVNAKNSDGWTARRVAAREQRRDVVEYLDSLYFGSLLNLVAYRGNFERVKVLVEAGADVNAANDNGSTTLIWAALRGHFEIVQYLVEQGADVTATNSDGETARDVALTEGHTEVAEYLESVGG